jgi:tetraacyldisaccharide 4'-kinase
MWPERCSKEAIASCFFAWGQKWIGSPTSFLFFPASWLFLWIAASRNFFYDRGWLPVRKVAIPVLSIGNIALGGRGKTPLVILAARRFEGKRVAILARGYAALGGLNDEMQVIGQHLPWVRLYQGKDRCSLAKQAVKEGAELILLDDGFQHRRLHRDWDWVVIRREDLRGRCPPCGELRESPRRLSRADALFSYEAVEGSIQLQNISFIEHSIQNTRVSLFCGIGRPERFRATVEALGGEIVGELFLGDHRAVSLKMLERFYEKTEPKYLLCTEKDWVKLPPHHLPILPVRIEAEVVGGHEKWEALIAKIKEKMHH